MTPPLSPHAIEEYRALRDTIRERGTMRMAVIVITFLGWGMLTIAVPALLVVPVMGLIPLAVLAAGFEVVFAAHVGVERVGRFLQVHYEDGRSLPGWEHAAMQVSPRAGGAGIDPLMSVLFATAAVLNLAPIALLSSSGGPALGGVVPLELAVYGGLHVVFIGRVVHARRYARRQRREDLALFAAARSEAAGGTTGSSN
jgi:predicted membrane metal-binding protein